MSERIADNPELIVDDMKRKARRRLVGAIVLALAAAIILPMLLEKEPRPLGDDVSVQIPPVDDGKFINRLTGKAAETKPLTRTDPRGAPAEPRAEGGDTPATGAPSPLVSGKDHEPSGVGSGDTAPNGRKAVSEAEKRVLAPPSKAPSATPAPAAAEDAKASAKSSAQETAPAVAPAADSEAKAAGSDAKASAAESRAADPATRNAASEMSPTGSAAVTARSEGYVVQLAAYADDKGANSLANKLKKAGYAAYVQPVETSRGTLWRVRVAGYASRPEADAARVKLKGEGYSGIVAPSK